MSIRFPVDAGGFDRLESTNGALWGSSAGVSVSAWFYFDGDASADGATLLLDDTTDAVVRIWREAAADGGRVYVEATTDNGSTVTRIGDPFDVPQGEWVGIAARVVDGNRKVWMHRSNWPTGTADETRLVASDTAAYAGTPSETTIWRIGNAAGNPIGFLMRDFAMCGGSAGVPSEAAITTMLTNKQRAERALGSALRWIVPLDQSSGTVTDTDTGLDDPVSPVYTTTTAGTTAMAWDALDPGLDADLLVEMDTSAIPTTGRTVNVGWDATGASGLGTVSQAAAWSLRAFLRLAGGVSGYDLAYLNPAGADSFAESSGDIDGAWGLGGRAYQGEAALGTVPEGFWADDSTPDAFKAKLQAGVAFTNNSTLTRGNELTRFEVAPIAVSVTPHDRPVAGGSVAVNIAVMDEWVGTQAVRFKWYAADGTTPKSVPFTPHGGSASTATSHTMTASAWVAPFAESSEQGEFWGGVLDVSGEADGARIRWNFEVQDHHGTWHTACSDGTAWPQKSILVHTDPLVINVATTGNDTTGDGSSGNPYATLGAAGLLASVRGASKPVEVRLAAGTYTIADLDARPGGTGDAHGHLITLRPAAGLALGDVTLNNAGLSLSATKRGNFELRDLAVDFSSTVYGWSSGTSNVEDTERTCVVNCTYTDGEATKASGGTGGLGIDGDDCYVIKFAQVGKFRGFAFNEFNPGDGHRGVRDVIVWDYEQTKSGTATQECLEGGYFGRCYIHDNAKAATYPSDQHFDCFHPYALNGSTHRRVVRMYNRVEDNGVAPDPEMPDDPDRAYNFCLTTCDNVDNGSAFNIRRDIYSQPAWQTEARTQNFQMAFNVDDGTVNFIRDDGAADDDVGRQILVQNNLLGNLDSFRNKLADLPERVLGGNVIATESGTYPEAAEVDGSLLVASSSAWGLSDYAGGTYTPTADGNAATGVTTRPTNFRFDFAGNPINRASPYAAGAYAGTASSSARKRKVVAMLAGATG